MKSSRQGKSALIHILLGLVPYTRQNMQLTFHPHRFFNELERLSGYSEKTLRVSLYRAERRGLVTRSTTGQMGLSLEARQAIQPFIAQKLRGGGKLMVIFDVPEEMAAARRRLRQTLQQFQFRQIQRSVWMSDMDSREVLRETIDNLCLQPYVQLYEAARLK